MVPVVAANARVSLPPFAIVYIIILLHHWYNKYLIVNGDANTLVSDVMQTSVYREVSCARMQTGPVYRTVRSSTFTYNLS